MLSFDACGTVFFNQECDILSSSIFYAMLYRSSVRYLLFEQANVEWTQDFIPVMEMLKLL